MRGFALIEPFGQVGFDGLNGLVESGMLAIDTPQSVVRPEFVITHRPMIESQKFFEAIHPV